MNCLSRSHKDFIIEVWNISRIPVGNNRHERLLYTRNMFMEKYPEFKNKPKTVWFFIVDTIS